MLVTHPSTAVVAGKLLGMLTVVLRRPCAACSVPPPDSAAAMAPIYQAPSTGTLTYAIRVSVHNGRTFVGPAYELTDLTHLDVPGWKVLQVRH